MRLRKTLCLVLIFALLVCLCVPASADVSLFFVAVNDTVPLTLTILPTYSGGTLYVPYQVFDSQPCGVTPSYNLAFRSEDHHAGICRRLSGPPLHQRQRGL